MWIPLSRGLFVCLFKHRSLRDIFFWPSALSSCTKQTKKPHSCNCESSLQVLLKTYQSTCRLDLKPWSDGKSTKSLQKLLRWLNLPTVENVHLYQAWICVVLMFIHHLFPCLLLPDTAIPQPLPHRSWSRACHQRGQGLFSLPAWFLEGNQSNFKEKGSESQFTKTQMSYSTNFLLKK